VIESLQKFKRQSGCVTVNGETESSRISSTTSSFVFWRWTNSYGFGNDKGV